MSTNPLIANEGYNGSMVKMESQNLSLYYGKDLAIQDVSMKIFENTITALIGPSGCGKSTLLRSFNRMNELIPGVHIEGKVLFHGEDLNANDVDPVAVRRRIGMVFQKPNPFPKSIYDNVAFGPRIYGYQGDMDALVEETLRSAALWDEVKGKLDTNGLELSGGQQQRLCIARTIAVKPEVILMDEPTSALDPIAAGKIEDLLQELKEQYTILIVTHNMQQAARVSDLTAYMMIEEEQRSGVLVEYNHTNELFTNPIMQSTQDYITGRFG